MLGKFSISAMALSIFILILPFIKFFTALPYGAVNSKYFFIVGFSTLITLYFTYLLFKNKASLSLNKSWLLYGSLIVFVFYYISSFIGVDVLRSFWSDILRSTGILFLTAVALIGFVVSRTFSERDWSLFRMSVAISSGVFALWSFAFFGTEVDGLTFGNSTFAGAYLLLGLAVTLIELFKSEKRSNKWKLLIGLSLVQFFSPLLINLQSVFTGEIFSNPVSILGSARASGAVAILMVLFLLISILINKYTKSSRKVLLPAWILVFFISIVSLVSMLFVDGSFVQNKYIESSTNARIILWDSGLEAFKEKPVFGWGPENFRYAFEQNFNNNLYLQENIGEVWFDRAHNVGVDSLVSVGIVGTLATVLLFIYFSFVIYRAHKKGMLSIYEALILGTIPWFHILQLQTSFDTPASYVLFILIISYGLWLEKEMNDSDVQITDNKYLQKIVAGVLLIITLFGSYHVVFKEFDRQRSLTKVFKASELSEQEKLIVDSFGNKIDFETLRLSSNSLIKGLLSQIADAAPEDRARIVEIAFRQVDLYEENYLKYLDRNPDDYRARMNYAHLLLIRTVLGDPHTDEVRQIVEESYALSPANPLTYVIDALAYLYSGNLENAKEKVSEAVALNPEIEFSQESMNYILEQEKRFPNISVLNIENL